MSLESLLGILQSAGELDNRTTATRHPKLLQFGVFATVTGFAGAVFAALLASGCMTTLFLLLTIAGLVLLLAYALEAKLYGRIALALIVLLVVVSIAILIAFRTPPPRPALAAASSIAISRSGTDQAHAQTTPRSLLPARPQPPATSRTMTVKVEVEHYAVQVYLDPAAGLAHRAACRERTARMLRTPRAAALMQGYVLHQACSSLKDPPEYQTKTLVRPEWIEYERQLAAYESAAAVAANAQLITATTLLSPSPTASGSSSAVGSSSDEVSVKGYYRKDGTYVRPHTRSKPRK